MSGRNLHKLLASVLAGQVETGQYGALSPQRLREALTSGPDLNDAERALLLLSPVARDDWDRARREVLDEVRDRWIDSGARTELVPLAAASASETGQIDISGADFAVSLFRQDDEGTTWVILVQLGPTLRAGLHPMSALRLVDDTGLEWARGRPDAQGELLATWQNDQISLQERASVHRLRVEPI